MTQWLRKKLHALADDLSLVPSIHVMRLTTVDKDSSTSDFPQTSALATCTYLHRHANTQNQK